MPTTSYPVTAPAPTACYAGDSLAFDVVGSSVSPADGWALRVVLLAQVAIDGTAAADGTGWRAAFAAEDTAKADAGSWSWAAIATRGTERVVVATGALTVRPNPAGAGPRRAIFEEQALAAVEAQLLQLYQDAVTAFTHADRQAQLRQVGELEATRAKLRTAIWRKRNGNKLGPRVEMHFTRPA